MRLNEGSDYGGASPVSGGYDDGYRASACFWGREPGSLVALLASKVTSFQDWQVLDIGCGEGKNAAFLAARGASVRAVDVSPLAIRNARAAWGDVPGISWGVADVDSLDMGISRYDLIVAYGLLHCLRGEGQVAAVLSRMQLATRLNGYNVVCSFNSRHQELEAHPGFDPILLPHSWYAAAYGSSGWRVVELSDRDLIESHPNNNIVHRHSMTRIVAQRLNHPPDTTKNER